jgi:hypothetical protein
LSLGFKEPFPNGVEGLAYVSMTITAGPFFSRSSEAAGTVSSFRLGDETVSSFRLGTSHGASRFLTGPVSTETDMKKLLAVAVATFMIAGFTMDSASARHHRFTLHWMGHGSVNNANSMSGRNSAVAGGAKATEGATSGSGGM